MRNIFVIAGIAGIATLTAITGPTSTPVQAQNNFEKCYGISKIGKNDGWGKQINPGKYKSEEDYDGMAWKFVKVGTCKERGGLLEPFAGFGTPVIKPNTSG